MELLIHCAVILNLISIHPIEMARFRLLVNNNHPQGDYDAKRLQFNKKLMKRWKDLTTIHFTIKRARLDSGEEQRRARRENKKRREQEGET